MKKHLFESMPLLSHCNRSYVKTHDSRRCSATLRCCCLSLGFDLRFIVSFAGDILLFDFGNTKHGQMRISCIDHRRRASMKHHKGVCMHFDWWVSNAMKRKLLRVITKCYARPRRHSRHCARSELLVIDVSPIGAVQIRDEQRSSLLLQPCMHTGNCSTIWLKREQSCNQTNWTANLM